MLIDTTYPCRMSVVGLLMLWNRILFPVQISGFTVRGEIVFLMKMMDYFLVFVSWSGFHEI